MTLTVCKTCILIKKISDKDTKIQSTLKTKFLHKQVFYQSNTRHIPPNTGLLPALISLSEMKLKTYIPPCSLSTMGLVIGCPVGILGPRYVPPLSRVTKPQLTQCPILCWQQQWLWQIHQRLHSGELEATGKHGLWEEMRKYM